MNAINRESLMARIHEAASQVSRGYAQALGVYHQLIRFSDSYTVLDLAARVPGLGARIAELRPLFDFDAHEAHAWVTRLLGNLHAHLDMSRFFGFIPREPLDTGEADSFDAFLKRYHARPIGDPLSFGVLSMQQGAELVVVPPHRIDDQAYIPTPLTTFNAYLKLADMGRRIFEQRDDFDAETRVLVNGGPYFVLGLAFFLKRLFGSPYIGLENAPLNDKGGRDYSSQAIAQYIGFMKDIGEPGRVGLREALAHERGQGIPLVIGAENYSPRLNLEPQNVRLLGRVIKRYGPRRVVHIDERHPGALSRDMGTQVLHAGPTLMLRSLIAPDAPYTHVLPLHLAAGVALP